MVRNKSEVLKRIALTAQKGTKILLRLLLEEDYKFEEEKYLNSIGNYKIIYKNDKKLYLDETPYYLIVLDRC